MSEAKPFGWIADWQYEDVLNCPSLNYRMVLWPDPQDKTGLVPLFAKPEPYGPQWTKEPPTVAGHYWVWQPAEDWPCHGGAMQALVNNDTRLGGFRAWTPKMNYGEYCGPETSDYSFWQSALWLGPIAAPSPPTKEQL